MALFSGKGVKVQKPRLYLRSYIASQQFNQDWNIGSFPPDSLLSVEFCFGFIISKYVPLTFIKNVIS